MLGTKLRRHKTQEQATNRTGKAGKEGCDGESICISRWDKVNDDGVENWGGGTLVGKYLETIQWTGSISNDEVVELPIRY